MRGLRRLLSVIHLGKAGCRCSHRVLGLNMRGLGVLSELRHLVGRFLANCRNCRIGFCSDVSGVFVGFGAETLRLTSPLRHFCMCLGLDATGLIPGAGNGLRSGFVQIGRGCSSSRDISGGGLCGGDDLTGSRLRLGDDTVGMSGCLHRHGRVGPLLL